MANKQPRAVLEDATILLCAGYYLVRFPNMETHLVMKDRQCSCGESGCAGILSVLNYLRHGGERAPDQPLDERYVLPLACPVCGGNVHQKPSLGSPIRGMGWKCETSEGDEHYWFYRGEWLIQKRRELHDEEAQPCL